MFLPGARVRIGNRFRGHELYDADDPEHYAKYFGCEATVKKSSEYGDEPLIFLTDIEGFPGEEAEFFVEEIDSIVGDENIDIEEGEESLDDLFKMLGIYMRDSK